MNSRLRHYFFGIIFFGLGGYYIYAKNFLEASLYIMAGSSFIINNLTNEPGLAQYKKLLVVLSWVFIIATGILFLWVLQSRYL